MTADVPAWFTNALAAPCREQTIEVDACPIKLFEWGTPGGPGLVLVHGGAAHAAWWRFLAPFFSESHHVMALDLSGHGESGHRSVYQHDGWPREILAAMAACGMRDQPVMVGHSMGGLVASYTANLFPDHFGGVVISDFPLHHFVGPKRRKDRSPSSYEHIKPYPDLETAVSRFRLLPDQPFTYPWMIDYLARHSLRQTDAGWLWKFDPLVYRKIQPFQAQDFPNGIKSPVAFLRGALSTLVTADAVADIRALFDRPIAVVEIPDAWHHLVLDQPLAFVSVVRAFLEWWSV